jgi:hypothetical protein
MSENQESINSELQKAAQSGNLPSVVRFILSSLGGIPVVGGVFGAGAGAWSEKEQKHFNNLLAAWVKLQTDEIKEIGTTLAEVMARVDKNDEDVQRRIESPEYLRLIKKAFRNWSAAESEEKRKLIRNLLANAAGKRQICGDDVIGLFIEWIGQYSEGHFQIIRLIHQDPSLTRYEIWKEIHGGQVREDSPEADLFKKLIQDLSLGHVIRQYKQTDSQGNFILKRKRAKKTMYAKSAFDDKDEYVLTGLGEWFVHYTMNEIVPKLTNQQTTAV